MTGFVQVLFWIVTGAIAGTLAAWLLKARRTGCFINIIIGIVGGFIGGFIMNALLPGGLIPGIDFLNQIITSTLGAIVLLVVAEIVLPGKQLGVTEGEEGGRRRRRRG